MKNRFIGLTAPISFAIFMFGFGLLFNTKALAVPISPDKYFIDVTDNTPVTKELTIFGKQSQDGPKKVFIRVLGMQKTGETDERQFFKVDPEQKEELAANIKLSQTELTVNPGETIVVPWTLTPTNELSCGTSLAALLVTENPEALDAADNSNVGISSELVSQIHVNVNSKQGAECDNQVILSLVEFKVDQGLAVFNHGNVPFVTRVQNKGNVISRNPKGYIEVFGLGDKVALVFNPTAQDIYPSTTREFSNQWKDENYPENGNVFTQLAYELTNLRLGRYEARLGITKNVEPVQITASTYFWVLPWKIIIVFFVVVALIIGLGVMLNNSMRMNKKLKAELKKKDK